LLHSKLFPYVYEESEVELMRSTTKIDFNTLLSRDISKEGHPSDPLRSQHQFLLLHEMVRSCSATPMSSRPTNGSTDELLRQCWSHQECWGCLTEHLCSWCPAVSFSISEAMIRILRPVELLMKSSPKLVPPILIRWQSWLQCGIQKSVHYGTRDGK
jgi:hypothetical protein